MRRFVLLGLVCTTGCGGTGAVEVFAYGESFIEEGITASAMADGWAVRFTRFDVEVDRLEVGGVPITVASPIALAQPSGGTGHRIGMGQVPAGGAADVEFRVVRIHVVGEASRGGERKTFDWDFPRAIRYDECETAVRVDAGATASLQLTFHADHLFVDSLVSETPALRFQALADADTNTDGVVSQVELQARDIGTYDPGSASGVDTLWQWLTRATESVGHVNGEAHCASHLDTSTP